MKKPKVHSALNQWEAEAKTSIKFKDSTDGHFGVRESIRILVLIHRLRKAIKMGETLEDRFSEVDLTPYLRSVVDSISRDLKELPVGLELE